MTRCVLGIDIGGTTLKAGLVDRAGRFRAERSQSSRLPDRETFRRALEAVIADLGAAAGGSVEAAGIGCKGTVVPGARRVHSLPGAFSFLEGAPLDRWIERALERRIQVRLDNDARAALAGERRWGAARGKDDVVLLTLGSGVGGAIVSHGRILGGHAGVAGHLGHIGVEIDGPACSCGNRGCLEAIFSARAIEGEALAAIRRGCESRLYERFRAHPEELSCLDVFAAAREGDGVAGAIVSRGVAALGAAMAGIAAALDPDLFLVGGQIAEAGEALLEPLRRDLHRRTSRLLRRRIPIRRAALGERAGIAGAAALGWDALESNVSGG
jgi:glucokinase